MMMVSGISYPEYLPAVAVPPQVLPRIDHTSTIATDLLPVQPYSASEFQQHENPYDRTRQDSYDMHGKMVCNSGPTSILLSQLW